MALRVLKLSIAFGAIAVPMQVMVGDQHGLNTLEHQPAKVMAMEGHYDSHPDGAPLILFGIPNPADKPQAELWMGAHPNGCSEVVLAGQAQKLSTLIENAPAAVLGCAVEGAAGVGLGEAAGAGGVDDGVARQRPRRGGAGPPPPARSGPRPARAGRPPVTTLPAR